MKIWWRGHSSFIIQAEGKKIVTDPFEAKVGYPLKPLKADIVTVSHDHWDHNAVDTIQGRPHIVRNIGNTDIGGIKLQGIASFHDHKGGRERGPNIIFKITAEGLALVHLGDLGHPLDRAQVEQIGQVDILLVPVGGTYTIDAGEAAALVVALRPKIVIPMHFSTPHVSFTLAPLERFTSYYDQVIKKPYLETGAEDIGSQTRVIVLDYLSS
ncbi:MAG: MBL fold metallo-hydrolase [Syntrophomonadaceae bacterium]